MITSEIKSIPIGKIIITGENPRQAFDLDALQMLGDSIESHGLLQPIIVRPKEEYYELVVGERRLRAAQLKGIDEIIARIEDLDDTTCMELRLIENTHREDLTDAEKGDAIYSLIEKYPIRYSTIKSVADSINTPYSTVLQWTTKSRKLSNHVRDLISENILVESQASYLMKYDHATQDQLADIIVSNELSSVTTPKFLKLFDENPDSDLQALIDEAKGVRKVEIEVERLSEPARKEVERILEERAKETEQAREKALERAWQAPRRRKPDKPKQTIVPETTSHEVSIQHDSPDASLDTIPLWKAMEELELSSDLKTQIRRIRNAQTQFSVGQLLTTHDYDEWETRKLIEIASTTPDLSIQQLMDAITQEIERRKRDKFITLVIHYKTWEALDTEAVQRRGPTGRLEIMDITRELLKERLKDLGHSVET
jgi:ParB family chromosome partitioning protein